MRAKSTSPQVELLKTRLDQFVDLNHALCKLARVIDWGAFDEVFGRLYCEGFGRPAQADASAGRSALFEAHFQFE